MTDILDTGVPSPLSLHTAQIGPQGRSPANREKVTVIVPAYNERDAAGQVLDNLDRVMNGSGYDFEIIFVDDGSEDETWKEAETRRVKLIRHQSNKGYGSALKSGIRAAEGEVIVITDADGTYPTDRIPDLLGYMDRYQMVVGARIGQHVNMPLARRPAKWLLGRLANYLANTKIPDLNSGLRAFRKDVARQFLPILSSRFSFTTTITLAFLTNDYQVKYIPIDYHRRIGRSKIRPLRDTLYFLFLIIQTVSCFNPLRVFLPMSLFLFFAGCLDAIGYIYFQGGLSNSSVLLLVTAMQVGAFGFLADLVVRTRALRE